MRVIVEKLRPHASTIESLPHGKYIVGNIQKYVTMQSGKNNTLQNSGSSSKKFVALLDSIAGVKVEKD